MQNLVRQVQANCQIASAGQVGFYSLCGMLLRLRQLYKWEQGLLPWQEGDPQEVLAWIARQEEAWSDLEAADLQDLAWQGKAIDPFAVEELNRILAPEGLAYGAGFTHGLAPMCFLGELWETRQLQGLTLLVLGPELARDMDAAPALRQGEVIYLRTEPLAFYLWDHLSDPTKQNNIYFQLAASAYGLDPSGWRRQPALFEVSFQELLRSQGQLLIQHEIGEALEPALQTTLPILVQRFPHSKVERWVRALKDALADLNDWGRVRSIIERREMAELALLLAWRPGFYQLQRLRDWEVVETARRAALQRLRDLAAELEEVWQGLAEAESAAAQAVLEERFLRPLGL